MDLHEADDGGSGGATADGSGGAAQQLSAAELRAAVAAQCMEFHSFVRELSGRYRTEARRHFYVTPTSYLQLLDSFRVLLAAKQGEVSSARRRYEVGLEKLLSTESQVWSRRR
eukprot:364207-Chlamydomonas_euryale.AAC.9